MRTTIKTTNASARCYPSVNGTSRRLWPSNDVVGVDSQGRACLRSEGWFPKMAGVKDGLEVKKTTTYYYDASASQLSKTLFEIRVNGITQHTIKWTGTKLTDNDKDIAVKKDGNVQIFTLDAEGTIASALAWPQVYYVEEE